MAGIIAVLWICVFTLSCVIYTNSLAEQSRTGRSLSKELLYAGKIALSAHFYDKADTYFHKGVEHIKKRTFENSIFSSFHDIIHPQKHRHLEGKSIDEIMPWLRMATQADSHHVEAYLVAAFWLASEGNRIDLAHTVLTEARINNPNNYEIRLAQARLYLRQGLESEAMRETEAGLRLWPGYNDPNSRDIKLDKASLLFYQALLLEKRGHIPEAILAFRQILDIFPERTHIKNRIRELEEYGQASLLPSNLLDVSLSNDMAHGKKSCRRDGHNHHDHDHAE
ncbi:MAG: tetratricopeptide repeat protein [Lentisphaerae bacterium]|nr:tetratricopeptide repeat protein [Lentisphaerota bacterium]